MEEYDIIDKIGEFNQRMKLIHPDNKFFKFKKCLFKIPIKIPNQLVSIDIEDCIFEDEVQIKSCLGSTTFKKVIFKQKVDFSNFDCPKKVRFHSCNFEGKTNFDNATFHDLADFWNSTFFHKTLFFKTDFLGITVFSTAKFKENVLFTYTLLNNKVIFRGTHFEKGLDLSLAILGGQINIFDIKLGNFRSVLDFEIEEDYESSIRHSGEIPHKNKKETFRLLKKELSNQGNSIGAREFEAYEKSAYHAQLKSKKNIGFKDKIQNWQNRFILWLGNISNLHGESWMRGVVFTFSIGLFLFYISVLCTDKYILSYEVSWNIISSNIENFFVYMLPTHKPDYLDHLNPAPEFYVFDFLGRIFVSFGIYQTIIAFRKYHSK